jgi:hypothetical protein
MTDFFGLLFSIPCIVKRFSRQGKMKGEVRGGDYHVTAFIE